MRRLLLVLMIAAVLLPLSASHVVTDGTLPDDVLSVLAATAGKETYGRADLLFSAADYSETVLDDGAVKAMFMFSFGDKQIAVEFFGMDREELMDSLRNSIHGILFYEEMLYSGSELSLGYIIDGNYSLVTDEVFRRGERLQAVDSFNDVRGLFEVGETYNGAISLDPVFVDDPFPGMRLERAGAWKLMGTVSSGLRFSSPEIFSMISLGRTDLIYPFVPTVSLAYRFSSGRSFVYGGVGIEAYMNLSRIFPSVSFTLVQEGRIGASASVLAGGGESGFDWSAVFSIFYEHRALPSFFWRFGYQNLQGSHMLVLGFGGDF